MKAKYFLGVDPAPSEGQFSDDGALVVGKATPKGEPSKHWSDWNFDYVYARRLTSREKATTRQWSGIIHTLERRFGFEKIVMDPSGGGTFVQRDLLAEKQLIEGVEMTATPIGDLVTGMTKVVHGRFNLHMFKRGDTGLDALWPGLGGDELLLDAIYSALKMAFDCGTIGLVPRVKTMRTGEQGAVFDAFAAEQQWAYKNLDALVEQLLGITVATKESQSKEEVIYALTKRGAHQFDSVGKKDFVSAALFAYAGFLVWLNEGAWDEVPEEAGGSIMSF